MLNWRDEDVTRFLKTFDSYWPGRLKLADPQDALLRTWRDVARAFNVHVAMAALQELFETQERPVAPTPAAFKSIAVPMQRYANDKRRAEVEGRKLGEKLMTPQECAADDSIWEPVLDRAVSEQHLNFLKKLRARLANGGHILGAQILKE